MVALIYFAVADPRFVTGCLFYKMRAGKHRLGPQTRALIEDLDANASAAYEDLLKTNHGAVELPAGFSLEAGAKYLGEQIALASTHRASGVDPSPPRHMLTLALSVFRPPATDRAGSVAC